MKQNNITRAFPNHIYRLVKHHNCDHLSHFICHQRQCTVYANSQIVPITEAVKSGVPA